MPPDGLSTTLGRSRLGRHVVVLTVAQLPISSKPVSGQSTNVIVSVATRAFIGTNPEAFEYQLLTIPGRHFRKPWVVRRCNQMPPGRQLSSAPHHLRASARESEDR